MHLRDKGNAFSSGSGRCGIKRRRNRRLAFALQIYLKTLCKCHSWQSPARTSGTCHVLLLFSILWFIFRESDFSLGVALLDWHIASLGYYNRVPKTEGPKNQKFISPNSGDWKSEIKGLGIQYVLRILFWFRDSTFLLGPHMLESELWCLSIL